MQCPLSHVQERQRLLLHLVDELLPRNSKLICDYIAHVHQILEALLQHLVHADIVCCRLSKAIIYKNSRADLPYVWIRRFILVSEG